MSDNNLREEVNEEPKRMSGDDVHSYTGVTLDENGRKEEKEEPERKTGFKFTYVEIKNIPWYKKVLYGALIIALVVAIFTLGWIFIGAIIVTNLLYRLILLIKRHLF